VVVDSIPPSPHAHRQHLTHPTMPGCTHRQCHRHAVGVRTRLASGGGYHPPTAHAPPTPGFGFAGGKGGGLFHATPAQRARPRTCPLSRRHCMTCAVLRVCRRRHHVVMRRDVACRVWWRGQAVRYHCRRCRSLPLATVAACERCHRGVAWCVSGSPPGGWMSLSSRCDDALHFPSSQLIQSVVRLFPVG
jgi:hypothetical protein